MKHIYFLLIFCFTITISKAQIVNIPDANFKNELLNNYPVIDTNGDGEVELSEAQTITYLGVAFSSIQDLTGIEAFTNLVNLDCRNNELSSLDLSNNMALFELDCSDNQLTSLILGNNTTLQRLRANQNQLSALDVSSHISLREMSVNLNSLTSLDISNNIILEDLSAYNNNISTLNLNGAEALKTLSAGGNQLIVLDVSNNLNLESLGASSNQLSSLDVSNNFVLSDLYANDNQLTNLNLSGVSSLNYLNCSNNQLSGLDISTNTYLETLYIKNNLFTNLNPLINNSTSLNTVYADDNQLSTLDLSGNLSISRLYVRNNQLTNLIGNNVIERIDCTNNLFTSLDLSQNFGSMSSIVLDDNIYLEYINFKNGLNHTYFYIDQIYNFDNLPSLQAVCVDDINSDFSSWIQAQNSQDIVFTEYCSFTPGGEYYTITGNAIFDIDNNGCDGTDINYSNLTLQISNGTVDDAFLSNESGEYTMPIQEGTYTITPQLENPSYFSVSPTTVSVNFPTDSSPFIQDFCITPNGVNNDLEITIVPVEEARPGFDTDYKIIYKNKGNTTLSGSIDFTYYDDYMNLLSANPIADSQSTGILSWNYSDLVPFETREILFTMTLNTPTDSTFPLNGDDVLPFVATINPVASDETEADNVFNLDQIVVNSFDPNDKTCLEGQTVTPEQVGKYVHYLIRFENTGTANAVNIVVKDVIDTSKYDVLSLVPLDASHTFYSRMRNTNEVEFIFENIQLPFDDANNDGYVLFKIATLPTLVLGESFSNEAEIYFDYNAPIITNNETTTIQDNLRIDEYGLSDGVNLFPNPVSNYFMIELSNGLSVNSIEVFDIAGKSLLNFNTSEIYNISKLTSGIYFVKIKTDKGEVNKQIVKQ